MKWSAPKKPSVPRSRIPKQSIPSTPDGVAHTIHGLANGAFIATTKRGQWLYVPQNLRQQLPTSIWGNNSFRSRGWFCHPSEAHLVIATMGGTIGYAQPEIDASQRFLLLESSKEYPEVAVSIPPQLLSEWRSRLTPQAMQI